MEEIRGSSRITTDLDPPIRSDPRISSMYLCRDCGHRTEALTDMTDAPHPGCGGRFYAARQAAS